MELNTNGDIFPEGRYCFRIKAVPEKGLTPTGYAYYQFHFSTIIDGEERTYSERFMVWLMAPICRAIGFEELKPGVFDYEPSWCLNKEIAATIAHEKIMKGPSAGNIVARMKEIGPVNPAAPSMHQAALAAQAPVERDDIPF